MGRKKKNRKNTPISPRVRLMGSTVIALMLLGIISAAGWFAHPHLWDFLCRQKVFQLETICYTGNEHIDKEELDALLPDIIGVNIFVIDVEAVKSAVSEHPWIEEVTLHRRLPHKLVISVTEKRPLALINSSRCRAVDRKGAVLPLECWNGILDVPLIRYQSGKNLTPGSSIDDKSLLKVLHFLETMQRLLPELWEMTSEVSWDSDGQLYLNLAGSRTRILLGHDPQWQQFTDFYSFLIYEGGRSGIDDIKFVDLRFRGQVIVRRKHSSS